MQRCATTLAAIGLAILLGTLAQAADKPAKIPVLIITGDDVSVHPWREIAKATRDALISTGKFDVKVCEDPLILESASALAAYDVIVFADLQRQAGGHSASRPRRTCSNFVKGGKGFFVQHLASASFPKWEEFGKLCGRYWVMGKSGHGPRSVFEVKIVDKEHPITKGLEELQDRRRTLRQAAGRRADPRAGRGRLRLEQEDRAAGVLAGVRQGPRDVHNAFGHDGKALATPEVRKIIARGVEWAATGKVSEGK